MRVVLFLLALLVVPQLAQAQERELAQASPCDPDHLAQVELSAKANGQTVYHLGTFGDAPFWNPRTYAMKDGDEFVKLMLNPRTQEAFRKNGVSDTDLAELETKLRAGNFEEVMLKCGDPFGFMASQDWRGMTTIKNGVMGFNVKSILVTMSDGRKIGLIYWCGNPLLLPAPQPVPYTPHLVAPPVASEIPKPNPFTWTPRIIVPPAPPAPKPAKAPTVERGRKKGPIIAALTVVAVGIAIGIKSSISTATKKDPLKTGGSGRPPQ